MSILTATNLSQSYGFVDVFTGISVGIPQNAKIGLIGPNGIGKTTLLLLLAGLEEPSWGDVHVARGKRIGYLRQEAMDAFAHDENTVYREMLSVFDHLHVIEARMREIEHEMADAADVGAGLVPAHGRGGQPQGLPLQQTLLGEYGELQEQFTHLGGYDYETRIAQTLDGLGFNRSNWDTQVQHLSGGQKTRALLAKLLLEQPDLLILDEPTNHLDITAIEWLEKTLREWKGALLVSSHDRYFLDNVATTIWEMSRSHIEVYRGNYTAYTRQRDERFQRSLFVFQQEKARLDKEMAYIKANAPGDPSPISRGKLRRLTRDVVTIERLGAEVLLNEKWSDIAEKVGYVPFPFGVEQAEKRVNALRPPSPPPRLKMTLRPERRSGEIVLRTKGLVVGYKTADDGRQTTVRGRPSSAVNRLFGCDDLTLRWKERAALIGPNGAGKTTFIKTALTSRGLDGGDVASGINPREVVRPLAGSIELGASLKVGYFAQVHDELDPNNTVIEELKRYKHMSDGEARYYLAQFLFKQDDVFKPVSGLSGGERARLALACLALQGANFLVLDEPTNHLDITSQEVLQDVLMQYEGTLLLVSHDRYLIDKLATQIWHIEDERLRTFSGAYAEFVKWRERKAPSRGEGTPAKLARSEGENAPRQEASRLVKNGKNTDKKRAQAIVQIEAEIAQLEVKLAHIMHDLQAAGEQQAHAKVAELSDEFAKTQEQLEALMSEWEKQAV